MCYPDDRQPPSDNQEPNQYDEQGRPFYGLKIRTDAKDDGPVSFDALRDLLDALTPAIDERATLLVRRYSQELAVALDEMGVGP